MLNLMQKDALLEFFNLYFRKAAAQLSELLETRLYFNVIDLELHQAAQTEAWEAALLFAAPCEASAVCVLFSEEDGMKLIARYLKKELTSVDAAADVLLECSSVLLNAFTEGLSVLQERRLSCALPHRVRYNLWRECFVKLPENILRLNLVYSFEEGSAAGFFRLEWGIGAEEVFLQKTDGLFAGEGVKYGKAAD